jgi:hypothetical protein
MFPDFSETRIGKLSVRILPSGFVALSVISYMPISEYAGVPQKVRFVGEKESQSGKRFVV